MYLRGRASDEGRNERTGEIGGEVLPCRDLPCTNTYERIGRDGEGEGEGVGGRVGGKVVGTGEGAGGEG